MRANHTSIASRRAKLEKLAAAISLQGWKDFEVSLESDEFRIEKHGGTAACTVIMLPDQPTFQAHFALPGMSFGAISFNVGIEEEELPATMRFSDAGQAASWLLNFLETPAPLGDR